ncbi:MarR family transcriptional regulator [Microbacterium sp. NPDC079995]|uniref:MarR family winged helix-turn-helix transcriptional regulator n=1 Tax=unclassified Microbacterium TaxID=2609290 RepID=UPI00344D7E6B
MDSSNRSGRVAGDEVRRVLDLLQKYRVAERDMQARARRLLSVSENELAAMRFLLRQPDRAARPQDLLRHLAISSAAVTTMIDKLESAGRVKRRTVEGDRRAVAIVATTLAEEELRGVLGDADTLMEAAASGFTPSELRQVETFLIAVTKTVDGIAA